MTTELVLGGTLQIRDEEKREIEALVLPWDTDAETSRGLERFEKGAFDGVDPASFTLRQFHQDPPTGRGISLSEEDDGLHMAFRVAKTQAGDEQLELVRSGVTPGVSIGFNDGKHDRRRMADGRMQWIHKGVKVDGVLEVSTTYKPAFSQSAVLQVRESEVAEETVPETVEQSPAAPVSDDRIEAVLTRLDKIDERQRAFQVAAPAVAESHTMEKRTLEFQTRELAEVVTTGNEGVVPDALVNRVIGRITSGRPFLNAMTQIPAPAAGTSIVLPRITQNPLVAKPEAEKDEVASRATVIDTVDFPMETYAGAGDLSLQLIRRSSPEFLGLWLELLAEQYANVTDNAALDDLLGTAAVVEGTGTFDVETDSFGEAFTNTTTATSGTMKPNRIILSTTALVQFMNARSPSGGGGTFLYPSLSAISGFSAGGGNELGITLQPVWDPNLDDEAVDIIIGPSAGFIWCEDGAFQLVADVPSKAGRDVGLAGFCWWAPIYPAAFTTYVVAT